MPGDIGKAGVSAAHGLRISVRNMTSCWCCCCCVVDAYVGDDCSDEEEDNCKIVMTMTIMTMMMLMMTVVTGVPYTHAEHATVLSGFPNM